MLPPGFLFLEECFCCPGFPKENQAKQKRQLDPGCMEREVVLRLCPDVNSFPHSVGLLSSFQPDNRADGLGEGERGTPFMELLLWVKCLNIKDEYGNVTLFKCSQSRWGAGTVKQTKKQCGKRNEFRGGAFISGRLSLQKAGKTPT